MPPQWLIDISGLLSAYSRQDLSQANKEAGMNVRKRLELLLNLLPTRAHALDTKVIHERLRAQGATVTLRTVQRDLERLAEDYSHSVKCEATAGGHRWWANKAMAKWHLLPTDALNLTMIMDHAARFGMQAQVEKLTPLRDYASAVINDSPAMKSWAKKVVSSTRFVTLRPGKIDPQLLETLQQALLDGYAVEAGYLKRGAAQPRLYRLKPLGLSYQDSNIYLACVFAGHKAGDPTSALPLHRFVSARTIPDDIPSPVDFDIHSVSARRSLVHLQTDQPVRLVLGLSKEMHERLAENPLCEDQQLACDADGRWQLTGSLHLSQGLTLWLLSQGDALEVLEPPQLRESIAATAQRMATLYQRA